MDTYNNKMNNLNTDDKIADAEKKMVLVNLEVKHSSPCLKLS